MNCMKLTNKKMKIFALLSLGMVENANSIMISVLDDVNDDILCLKNNSYQYMKKKNVAL